MSHTPAVSLSPAVAAVSAAPAATPVPMVTPEPAPVYTFIGQAYCDADEFVNIRADANTESTILGTIPAGEPADVIEYSGDWAHIVYSGIEGYVSCEYLLKIKNLEAAVPMGDWASIVVNPTNLLPEDFEVTLADFENGQVDERILEVCERMFADAKANGVDLR